MAFGTNGRRGYEEVRTHFYLFLKIPFAKVMLWEHAF
jgi:hypothetical protein